MAVNEYFENLQKESIKFSKLSRLEKNKKWKDLGFGDCEPYAGIIRNFKQCEVCRNFQLRLDFPYNTNKVSRLSICKNCIEKV